MSKEVKHSKGSAMNEVAEVSAMTYTEMSNQVEAKLKQLAGLACERPKHKFTTLAHFMNEGFLAQCFRELGKNKAPGVDGATWEDYDRELENNLGGLVYRMKKTNYWPKPARRVYIPKDGHTKRPLGIPATEDKIVQKAVSRILESIYEADFLDCSYGFRPGRSCHDALSAVSKLISKAPINHIVEADIKGFFDNVSHEWMMKFLGERINDPSFLRIVNRFLKAGYKDSELLVATEKGTPQGGNLSPLLANIFLHYVLDLWFDKLVKPSMSGECYLVRYADDFVILVQYQEDAARIVDMLRERFLKFELELHPDKTRVFTFGRFERQNAERQGRKANTFVFLGITHYCDVSRWGSFLLGHRTAIKRFRGKCKEFYEWIKDTRNDKVLPELWNIAATKLIGHYQYYGVSGNFRCLASYYRFVVMSLFKWLNKRSQRRSWNINEFNLMLKDYPLPKPRIVHNLYAVSGVR
jgi:RNA-directed DNA polymerase